MSESGGHVVVLAATNDIASLDPALLRPGRLDRRIHLRPPDLAARTAIILQRLLAMPLRMERDGLGRGGGRSGDPADGGLLGGSTGVGGNGALGEGGRGLERTQNRSSKHNSSHSNDGDDDNNKGTNNCQDKNKGGDNDSDINTNTNTTDTDTDANTNTNTDNATTNTNHDGGGGSDDGRSELHRPRRGLLDTSEAYAAWLARETEGASGADVTGVCREAALAALREDIEAREVAPRHFEAALRGQRPRTVAGGGRIP